MERYELVSSAVVAGLIPIKKYKSKETGITVCIANVDGPVVNGYFCLATEAFDDDGLPHTLEHLIFLGSEEYPYKGMLDLFANRCLATGTNAWTDTDHTCYTINTAGSEGFLNIMAIFLDHIVYPTITETGFVTEVHHINGDGEDSGIVYCEMQARENAEYSIVSRQFLKNMYPGICGYKSETGGILKNLRTTCNFEKVCNYHRDFYRPDNLCLIVTGMVDPADVFKRLQPFEEKIKAKGALPPLTRPWISAVPPLEDSSLESHVLFPTEDESTGSVKMGWRGPDVMERYESDALRMLFKYLTETSVAPLQQELVEIEEPFCGDVYCSFYQNKATAFCIDAEAVIKENLPLIKDKVFGVLKNIASGTVPLDMDRFGNVIQKSILEDMNELEDTPHDAMAYFAIGDFLYSDKSDQLQDHVDKIKRMKQLKTEDASFWLAMMTKYIIEVKMVVVIGEPSEENMKVSGEEEKQRVAQQVAALGEAGLKEKARVAEDAVEKNGVEPSPDIINKLPIPSTDSIHFHPISTLSNRAKPTEVIKEFGRFPLNGIPCAFQVHHCKSLFTEISVVVDTSSLSDELRMYLPLYAELFFESPILKDGVMVPYEEVVTQLEADTLSYSADIGDGGQRFAPASYAALFSFSLKMENEKYETGVKWVKDLMYNTKFSADRLKVSSNKIINSVANHKRSGQAVLRALHQGIDYVKESTIYSCNFIRQHRFLTQLVKDLDSSSETIISKLENLRTSLLVPENLRFYVSANLNNLPENSQEIWTKLLFQDKPNVLQKVKAIPRDLNFTSGNYMAKAAGIGSVESAFMTQVCAGVDDYKHPDYPAMLVFIEYLCTIEGPLWRLIRGLGLSYNYRITALPNAGKLKFGLAKSTHIFKAYLKAKEIMEGYLNGTTPFEFGQVEAARSGTLYKIISGEETISNSVSQQIYAEFKETDTEFRRNLLKQISSVTGDDLKRVGSKYFINLFDPSVTSVALCCHPTKIEEIVKSFASIGINFVTVSTLEEEFA